MKRDDTATVDSRNGSNTVPGYERFRPRMYKEPMSIFWWTRRWPYVHFILRELTSVAVAIYALFILYMVYAVSQGAIVWESLMEWIASPMSMAIHGLFLLALLYHSFTWIWIAPTAVVLKVAGRKVPGSLIILGNLALWLVLTLAIGWFIVSAAS